MARGRPPKSPQEKILEGRTRDIQVALFKPLGMPFVPEHLSDDAKACAEHIINNFNAKCLSSIDSYALAVFASAWAWHKCAMNIMSQPDFEPISEVTDKNGNTKQVPSPWFKILNEQGRMMMMVAPKLYLTPADRHSLQNAGQEKPASKFDGLTGRKTLSTSLNSSSFLPELDKEEGFSS